VETYAQEKINMVEDLSYDVGQYKLVVLRPYSEQVFSEQHGWNLQIRK